MLAELMVPDRRCTRRAQGRQADDTDIVIPDPPHSSMDAIAQGTREGIELLVNVTAMLIVAVALVALGQPAGRLRGDAARASALSIEQMLGWLFAPLAWLIGIPWAECAKAGTLLGVKTVLNELDRLPAARAAPGADALSDRSRLILTYALCGFANFGSLGILIGGMVAMVPARRAEIVSLGAKTHRSRARSPR